jgi:8-oxo-dGTP pyrophosphatase MutT (NUDIX family)
MSGQKVSFVQVYLYRRCGDGEMEYLVLRRAEDEDLYPGLWQMVTGRIEAGESASVAARRELLEETGVIAARLDVVPYVASFYFEPDDSIHHVPVFAAEAFSDTEVRLSSEHSACEWLRFDDAWRRLVFPGHREGLRILQEYVLRA